MNAKLVNALAQIIQSLTPEEKRLLEEKGNVKNFNPLTGEAFQERPFYEEATREEWLNALQKWSESHRKDIPLLSDEAVSRRGIYEED